MSGAGAGPRARGSKVHLEVRDACKRYGRQHALAGVGFSLSRGEWIGLLGPNGAGKTTLMRVISGLIRLDSGSIRTVGADGELRPPAAARHGLGLVPQEIALYRTLTARENLRVFGRLHGVRGARLSERIAWALEWTELAERADVPVSRYSGGMLRRLNIACGVLHRPRLVLLDEPTVGVDPQGRQRIWEMLRSLREDGASLLQSSHQLDEIQSLCDRMLILDHGRIVAQGTLDELAAETPIGHRSLRLVLDREPHGIELGNGFRVEGPLVYGDFTDVPRELSALLERVHRAGLGIIDIHVESPRLEEIFAHLTGRELRE